MTTPDTAGHAKTPKTGRAFPLSGPAGARARRHDHRFRPAAPQRERPPPGIQHLGNQESTLVTGERYLP